MTTSSIDPIAAAPAPVAAAPATRRSMQFQVLKTATQIKLRELNAHEQKLHAHYMTLLQAAGLTEGVETAVALPSSSTTSDTAREERRRRLDGLYKGIKELQIVQTKLHPDVEDVGGLVDFARSDMWSTQQIVTQRTQQLLREIRQRRSLWRHNKLLGALLKESLDETEAGEEDPEWEALDAGASHAEPLAAMTKEETQARLEEYFFQPSGVVESDVHAFLESHVFHRRDEYTERQWQRQQVALSQVRKALHDLSEDFTKQVKVRADEVGACIDLLLRNRSSFNDEVVAFLLDVKRSEQTKEELAHVLTIEISNLKEFAWPSAGIPVHMQRGMNGRFRCHIEEDAVTLLLFQFVGMHWGEAIKTQLSNLLNSLHSKEAPSRSSVEASRRELQAVFTLAALNTDGDDYGDDDKPTTDQSVSKAAKQDLIRLLCTEARFQQVVTGAAKSDGGKPSITAVTTDLEFFGPSISHEAILACLRFFGVTDAMCAIFARYMHIPLLFPGFTEPKPIVRGLSVGRQMSMFLAEIVLFVMDYLVRSSTDVHLFRRFDDIIFYGEDEDKVVQAWEAMQAWASVTKLSFNQEKSGSVRMQWTAAASSTTGVPVIQQHGRAPLPQSPIQWGLLELQSNASVRICMDKVEAFATEMAGRLAAAKSVFSWINVYNKYMFFFLRNFGSVAPVFGMIHIDGMLTTLQKIHRMVFPKSNGDVMVYLRDRIAQSTGGTDDIPAAWAQWPLELGGLGLHNPFLAIWSLKWSMYDYLALYHTRVDEPWPKEKKDWVWREPFTTRHKELVVAYRVFAERVQAEGLDAVYPSTSADQWFLYTKSDKISDAERRFGAIKHKLETSAFKLRSLDEYLAIVPKAAQLKLQQEFKACILQVTESDPSMTKTATQTAAEVQFAGANVNRAYWKWVAYIYSAQVMEEFGTVSFFSRELLPAQLIDTIKKTAVSW